jgi:hypothetical protein
MVLLGTANLPCPYGRHRSTRRSATGQVLLTFLELTEDSQLRS